MAKKTAAEQSKEGFTLVALQKKLTHQGNNQRLRTFFVVMLTAFILTSLVLPGFLTPSNELKAEKHLHHKNKPSVVHKHDHRKVPIKHSNQSTSRNRVQKGPVPSVVPTRSPVMPVSTERPQESHPKAPVIHIKIPRVRPTPTIVSAPTPVPTPVATETLLGPTINGVCHLVEVLKVC